MNTRTGMNAFAGWMVALTLALPGAALAANAPETAAKNAAPAQPETELSEVLVQGARTKPERNLQVVIEWLRRLVGQFRYQGTVELRGADGKPVSRQNVSGKSDCVAFGLAPGVQCSLKVQWPELKGKDGEAVVGGASTLQPAMLLYGLDPDKRGIHFLQVDNKGIADGGVGLLLQDTLTTKVPCEGIPGNCQRITKITAKADGSLIQTVTDIEQDGVLVLRYTFLMRPLMKFVDSPPAAK